MEVWTFQPVSALDQIEKNGRFICDPQKSFNLTKPDSLKKPYAWLSEKMRKKLGEMPQGVVSPVWAWHTWDFERVRPDPNSAAFLKRTEPTVAFTLDIPENELLLSDFDAWQFVMNGWYLSSFSTKEEYAAFLEEFENLSDGEQEKKIEESWNGVFNISRRETEDFTFGRYVQATFWELKQTYIKHYEIFQP